MRTLPLLTILLALFGVLAGCPGASPDDDDSAGTPDDDDALGDDDDNTPTPDDDDATPVRLPCEDVTDITDRLDGDSYTGTTVDQGDDAFGSCSNTAVDDVTLSFVAPIAGSYTLTTRHPGTDYDTLIFAFTDCEDPLGTELACQDDIVQGNVLESEISVDADAGQTVFVAVEGYDGTGNFELTLVTTPVGDDDDSAGADDDDSAGADDDDSAATTLPDDDDSAATTLPDDDDSAAR